VTIVVSLSGNLLIGIFAGILTKFTIPLFYGVRLSQIFTPKIEIHIANKVHYILVPNAAVYMDYQHLKSTLETLPKGKNVRVDFSDVDDIEHTLKEYMTKFKHDYESSGGCMQLIGFENHPTLADHPLVARSNQRITVMS
jgi:MFS superfamily sulfate permease-like transporter